jgi:hypothetical protein
MKWFSKKRLTSLILAVMMTVSAIALSAYANGGLSAEVPVEDGDGLAPGTNAQFWYMNPALNVQFPQSLPIGSATYNYTLGNNTIQEYFRDRTAGTYVVSFHPQFFGTTNPPNYDDQNYAYYIMNITAFLVYDKESSYVDCFSNGVAVIPEAYVINDEEENTTYFRCMVYSIIIDVRTGAQIDAKWNGKVIFLQIPAGL